MRIAITGARGGVGRTVTELALRQGHTVVALDRTPPPAGAPAGVTHLQGDITRYEDVEAAVRGCDALIHLAAYPSPWGLPDHEVHHNNVTGSYNALSAAARLGVRRIAQASSVNAIGLAYSRWPRFDYFPLDELHPNYCEEPYSLSKWICEQQADAFARRHESLVIASLRFHWVVPGKHELPGEADGPEEMGAKNLWGYVRADATARACLLSLTADFTGHEVFFIVAPDTLVSTPSRELAARYFPYVPIRGDLSGTRAFYDCSKAERLLGWRHDQA